MGKRFGVATRRRSQAQALDFSFWESKGSSGAVAASPPSSVPMVSAFADNRVARAHPDWVQVGPDGERGDRSARYFDWSTLCPTRDDVFRLALFWATQAANGNGLRLDDVNYARQGYCQCEECRKAIEQGGVAPEEFRRTRIASFLRAVRSEVKVPLYLTLYPDPYPGHLERRFGVDPDVLSELVDTFIVPIYDLAYSTTYWLEALAMGFADRLRRPFLVELYGLDVPEERLRKAAEVAMAYADGVLIAYDRDDAKVLRIRDSVLG